MDANFLRNLVLYLVPMILCITVHEYAHARAAYALGDDTASLHGRMTLNPLAHIDIFGTLLIPIIGIWTGFPFFGWAKPVPISPLRFTRATNMRTGILITAAAGPLSNIVFAVLLVAALLALRTVLPFSEDLMMVYLLLRVTILINVGLAFFNIIPIPPLDGSRVLMGILPDRYWGVMDFLQKYSFVLFGILLVTGGRILAYPVLEIDRLIMTILR